VQAIKTLGSVKKLLEINNLVAIPRAQANVAKMEQQPIKIYHCKIDAYI
jgi:hypothetical protein